MLTPDYLEYCADDIVELYSQLDETIIRDIARRIVKAGDITDTARWQIEKVQQGGMLYDDVIAEVSKITDASENQVKALFEDAGITSVEFDNEIYEKAGLVPPPTRMSESAYQILRAGAVKTAGNLKNLTMTTANTSQTAYINACTLAEMQVESGAFSYQYAIRNAVREAAKRGTRVLYPSGHTDRLDVAVRRAVLTGVSQTTGKVALQNANDMGCDLMEITAHSGARPSHSAWQGQIVSLSGRKGYLSTSDIGYGTGDGFKGWNCRHDWFPYFEGISERAYSDEDLKAIDAETVTYNDKTYTEYEATQVQRAMEREIRSVRRQLVALDELIKNGDDVAIAEFNYLSTKLKGYEEKLKDFCTKTDRKVDSFRVQVGGFDRSVSQKAVWAKKKAVEKSAESGIIRLRSEHKNSYKEQSYSDRKIELPENIKKNLSMLVNSGDYITGERESFSMGDISVMSKETGVEFACVTINNTAYLIRGDKTSTDIPKEILDEIIKNKGTLDFHSHPHEGDTVPSCSDRNVIKLLENLTGQQRSKIVTTDNLVVEFDKYGAISIESIPNIINDDYAEALKILFGGE